MYVCMYLFRMHVRKCCVNRVQGGAGWGRVGKGIAKWEGGR